MVGRSFVCSGWTSWGVKIREERLSVAAAPHAVERRKETGWPPTGGSPTQPGRQVGRETAVVGPLLLANRKLSASYSCLWLWLRLSYKVASVRGGSSERALEGKGTNSGGRAVIVETTMATLAAAAPAAGWATQPGEPEGSGPDLVRVSRPIDTSSGKTEGEPHKL